MNFLTVNDFIGEANLDLGDSNVQDQFNSFATQKESDILRDLLSDVLYNELIADLVGGVPQSAKFLQLANGTTYTTDYGQTVIYEGLKRMLKLLIWSEALDNGYSYNSSNGQMTSNNENSTLVSRSDLIKIRKPKHNMGVKLYNRAAIFINDKHTTYFTGNDYGFWQPVRKTFIGVIKTVTHSNYYFKYRSSEEN